MKNKITHNPEFPIGWVETQVKSIPAFICSKSGQPISQSNPGTLYWDPESGVMLVLSEKAEDTYPVGNFAGFHSIDLDVFSFHLFGNTASVDKNKLKDIFPKAAACD